MSELSYEVFSGGIKVKVPFALKQFFNALFKEGQWSGECQAHIVPDNHGNRYKLERLKFVSNGVYALDAEVKQLANICDEIESAVEGIEVMKAEMVGRKQARQKFIDGNSSLDLLEERHKEIMSEGRSAFAEVERESQRFRGRVENIMSEYYIDGLFIQLEEILRLPSVRKIKRRLEYIRPRFIDAYEGMKLEVRLDVKSLYAFCQSSWDSLDPDHIRHIRYSLWKDVDVLAPTD